MSEADDHRHEYDPPIVSVSVRVLHGLEPIRMVGHHGVGHWSASCGTVTEMEDIQTLPLEWLIKRRDVGHIVGNLPIGRMMVRDEPGSPWMEEADED